MNSRSHLNATTILAKSGENLACWFLKQRNWRILEKNWHCKYGEIDIIAFHPHTNTIVFGEVKTLSKISHHLPEASVNTNKQRKIAKSASLWFATHGIPANYRFDIFALILKPMKLPTISHIPDAFQSKYAQF